MPQMDLVSVACAIPNLWLAARAEGLGMGWVSMFDPVAVASLLGMSDGAEPMALLCIGPVYHFGVPLVLGADAPAATLGPALRTGQYAV